MSVTFYSLGAVEEVTGSKHILEVDGRSYLIDCGAFQGKRAVADKKNRDLKIPPEKIEAVVLTHAHYDHCGLLPYLVKKGYKGNIYATPATRSLANLIMMDSAHIQARDAEFLRKKAETRGEEFDWQPLFTEADVTAASNQTVGISYHRPIAIGPDVKDTFSAPQWFFLRSMKERKTRCVSFFPATWDGKTNRLSATPIRCRRPITLFWKALTETAFMKATTRLWLFSEKR